MPSTDSEDLQVRMAEVMKKSMEFQDQPETMKPVAEVSSLVRLAQKVDALTEEELKIQTESLRRREAEERKQKSQAHARGRREKGLKRALIPPRFRNKSFENFISKDLDMDKAHDTCRKYAKRFPEVMESGMNLVLTGSPGTGKTHLACAILNNIVEQGYSGLFVSISEMLRSIRSTFSKSAAMTEIEAFRRFIEIDLLVLDEVGISIGDETKRKAMIFDVLDGRYGEQKPTIVIGNLTVKEIEDYLGARVWDRLQEDGCPVIAFTWASYRRT